MREQTTKAQVKENKKQKLQDNTHPLSPLPHAITNQPPPPPTYPIPPPFLIKIQ